MHGSAVDTQMKVEKKPSVLRLMRSITDTIASFLAFADTKGGCC